VEIVVSGRHTEVPERFRRLAEEKLLKIAPLAPKAHRTDVELSHERNPRQSQNCEKVEITVRGKGPVIRAEASAEDPAAALDLAFGKLLERLRRTRDRRKVHHGRQTPHSVRLAPAGTAQNGVDSASAAGAASEEAAEVPADATSEGGGSPVVIRAKDHDAAPMTLDQALYEMELVGHDFYLFVDADSGRPSVVYRRRGWNYGVIRLRVSSATGQPAESSSDSSPESSDAVGAVDLAEVGPSAASGRG
jgi:ribosomal subunit interface protein